MGPRDGPNAGGSFRTASLRLSGTLVGAMWGYATLVLGDGLEDDGRINPGRNGGATYWLLALGVIVAGIVRHSPTHAYGPLVAQVRPPLTPPRITHLSDRMLIPFLPALGTRMQFTSFIMVIPIRDVGDVEGDSKRWSYLRIEANVVGAPSAVVPLLPWLLLGRQFLLRGVGESQELQSSL